MTVDSFKYAWSTRPVVVKTGLLAALAMLSVTRVQAEFDLDDIRFWVGHGTNRAALVLDWNDGVDPVSLAWGYRWNGSATGRDMFDSVVAADPRLVLFLYRLNALGEAVYGVGFDLDNDGSEFHPGSAGPTSETGYADDAGDHYAEGWYSQHWHYFNAAGSPYSGSAWSDTGGGFETRQLIDGAWDGWRPNTSIFGGSNTPPAVCVAAEPLARQPAVPTAGFRFRDIEVWTGSGTNRAALVIGWHDGTRCHALAWGYRWDGTATALDMWHSVTNADPGLSGTLVQTANGVVLTDCAYRRPVRHGDILPATHAHDVIPSAFATDHTNAPPPQAAWSHWTLDYTDTYIASTVVHTDAGLDNRELYHNAWDAWSRGTVSATRAPGWPSSALHYPYGDSVSSYIPGNATFFFDWISGDLFTNAAAALGRPTVHTTGDASTIPLGDTVPIVPVYVPFRAYELVVVGLDGQLIVAFDHKVLDNPANPYGLDFTIFGNAMHLIGQDQEWANGDPTNTTVAGTCDSDQGGVWVSQDGDTWYSIASNRCDRFMPTLGRVYDRNHPPGAPSNTWWGGATDPTVPTDPTVEPAAWQGMDLGAIAARYRGSAGGVGFNISALPLSTCQDTGHKWIRFIKITPTEDLTPEVDAVADVSPALPYDRWRNEHFDWMNDPADESDAADVDDDGIVTLMAYGLGRNPTNGTGAATFTCAVDRSTTSQDLVASYAIATNAPDVNVDIVQSANLIDPDWNTNHIAVTNNGAAPSNGVMPLVARHALTNNRAFFRLRVKHND